MKNKITAGLAALTIALSSVYSFGCSPEDEDCTKLLQSSSSLKIQSSTSKSIAYAVHKSMLESPYESQCPIDCTYLGETKEKYCCECIE